MYVLDTAFCKNANINKWFKFDDHEVYDIGNSDIKVMIIIIITLLYAVYLDKIHVINLVK